MNNLIKLKDIVTYSDERVNCSKLNPNTYIGTDNILQYKTGKVESDFVPSSGSTTLYKEGDILIANIRPYLKKIWYADNSGGSSPDVLTIRTTNKNYISKYVYYALFRDEFFEYMMKGSKGTKMPRGDKTSILDFPIPDKEKKIQRNIAAVLSVLDDKIIINNKVNKELETVLKEYFYYFFRRQNTKLEKTYIENIAFLKAGGDRPEVFSLYKTKECNIPIFSNGTEKNELYGYTNEPGITERCITISARGTIGYSVIRTDPFFPIIRLIVAIPRHAGGDVYLKFVLDTIDFSKSGSVQQQLTIPQIAKIKIPYPAINALKKFNGIATPLLCTINHNRNENRSLASLRDFLLPMLMNGQVIIKTGKSKRAKK